MSNPPGDPPGDGAAAPVTAAGTTAAPGRLARPLRLGTLVVAPMVVVLVCTAIGVLVNWLQKYPCHGGNYGEGRALRFACYTDVLALYSGHRLSEGAVPYVDHPVEYPVLTGFFMGLIGLPVNAANDSGLTAAVFSVFGLGTPGDGTVFYDIAAITLALFALLTAWSIVRLRPHRPYDALMFAFAPGLLLAATVNWDLLAVGLTAVALLAWSRRNPTWAGVFFGLAAAAKFFPLVILGPLLILCLRRGTREAITGAFTTIGLAAVTWLLVNLPVAILAPEGWSTFYRFSSERGVDWGTFWYIGDHLALRESGLDRWFSTMVYEVDTLNVTAWAFFAVCCAGIAALIWYAPRRPRLAAMAFLVVAVFLLTNKVWSQQFVLWLIPLAVLARPRWGFFLVWQASEVFYFLAFYQVQLRGGEAEFALTQAAVARWLSVAVLCGLVVYEALRPEHDVMRADGSDDPEGGFLDQGEFTHEKDSPGQREVPDQPVATDPTGVRYELEPDEVAGPRGVQHPPGVSAGVGG